MVEDTIRYGCSLGFFWYHEVRYHQSMFKSDGPSDLYGTSTLHSRRAGSKSRVKWREKVKMVQVHRQWSSGLVMCSGRSFWPQLSGKTTRPQQQFLFIRTRTSTAGPRTFIVKHCRVAGSSARGYTCLSPNKTSMYFLTHTRTYRYACSQGES